jgi:hypothetical protein
MQDRARLWQRKSCAAIMLITLRHRVARKTERYKLTPEGGPGLIRNPLSSWDTARTGTF